MATKKSSHKIGQKTHIWGHMINEKLVISYKIFSRKHFFGKNSDLHYFISREGFEIQKLVIFHFTTHSCKFEVLTNVDFVYHLN